MATMTNLPTEVADPTLAAELVRRRWQEKPAYFLPATVKPMPDLHAMWLRLPDRIAPVMHWSDLPPFYT